MAAFLPSYCMICDDVRIEVDGKEILIGVYPVGVSIPVLPWMGAACLRMTGYWSGEGELNFKVRVLNPANTLAGETTGTAHPIWQGFQSSITLRGVAISFEMEGVYEIQFSPDAALGNRFLNFPYIC